MDPSHAHIILPTNATSAANPLAATTPTAVARDTVVQTNLHPHESQSSTKDITTTKDYVLKEADVYKPLAVVSDSTPVTNANNQIVGSTASGSLTTPGKIVGDLETVVAEHSKAIVAEPVTDK